MGIWIKLFVLDLVDSYVLPKNILLWLMGLILCDSSGFLLWD